MFRVLIVLALISSVFSPNSVFSSELEEVTVLGIGETKSEAITDAQRQALIKVVGKYVVSRDRLKNRKELSENIYSYSNGFISDFEILGTSSANGLVEVEARAEVSRTKLFKVFEGLNISKISIDDSAGNLAGSSADQSRDFTSLMEDQLFMSLVQRNLFNVEIDSLEIVDSFPDHYEIYLNDSHYPTSNKIEPGDYFFEKKCNLTADCFNYWKKGLMTGISIGLKIQLKPDYVGKIKQLFDNVSDSKRSVYYECRVGCEAGGIDLSESASDITGVFIFEDGKGTQYVLSRKNELVFDNLVAQQDKGGFWIDVNITDFSSNSLAFLTFLAGRYDLLIFGESWRQHYRYGETGVLSYKPIYQAQKQLGYPKYHYRAFFPGINTVNYSIISGEVFNLTIPLMVTEEIASKLNEIEVEIRRN